MKPELKPGMVYTGTVISLQEAADSFPKKAGGGGTSWCHYITILLSGFEDLDPIEAQLCRDFPTIDLFAPNDDIKFSVTKLAHDRWTIQFKAIAKLASQKGYKPVKDAPYFSEKPAEKEIDRLSTHITIVTGTVPDRALSHAAHLFQYRANYTDEQFFGMVDKMSEYMKKNL